MHGIAEIGKDLLGTAAAGLVLIGVARLAPDQFTVFEGHTASANPIFPVADVDMIELCHASILMWLKCVELRNGRCCC